MKFNNLKRIGQVCVDSGQLTIVDPCYVSSDDDKHPLAIPNLLEQTFESFHSPVDIVGRHGDIPLAVNSPTYIGDGTFPVFHVLNAAGTPVGMVVSFTAISEGMDVG